MRAVPLLLAAAVALALLALPAGAGARELVVVQANVGNVNVSGCGDQVYKLCLKPVERRGAQALRAIDPDVVAFEEILPPKLCQTAPSTNPQNLCSGPLEPPSQVQRLLGDGHAFECDARFGWDCLAVRAGVGDLVGFETRPVQPACEDTGFTMSLATMRMRGWPITVTVAHPSSTDVECRTEQLRDFFESALPDAGPALVMGDFNLDPFRESDASVAYWKTQVPGRFRYASGEDFTLLPGPSQGDPTGETLDNGQSAGPPLGERTIDHVVVRGLSGTCRVERVDGGGGMDHRAQVCRIEVPRSATPAMRLVPRGCAVTAAFRPAPDHLRGVRFRVGRRASVDRRAPYRLALRGAERRRRTRVAVTPLLANGDGPRLKRTVRPCAGG